MGCKIVQSSPNVTDCSSAVHIAASSTLLASAWAHSGSFPAARPTEESAMRMLIPTAAIVTALALAGASAMAADANIHRTATAHVARAHAAVRVAARQRYRHDARAPYNYGSRYYNVGQL